MSLHPMKSLVSLQKRGLSFGICSVCSANKMVLKAVMKRGLELNTHILIEATANQVNQYGGYTGMKAEEFVDYVHDIAREMEYPTEMIILGGDHLGPLTWSHLDEEEAMKEARVLVADFVMAGFTKIHIDTSMKLKDDPQDQVLSTEVIARRGIDLIKACDEAFKKLLKTRPHAQKPVYVIGSEVPIPGGAQEEENIQVTKVEDFHETVQTFQGMFYANGMKDLWEDVIAVVVQPGVEFGDNNIDEYDRRAAKNLVKAIDRYPTIVFEGHSTDYQTPQKLKQMVEDKIAILKVGPAVTFALREGLFGLSKIEQELIQDKQANFIEIIEEEMVNQPNNWSKHYHGNEHELKLARKYSFSDRMRYYMGSERVSDHINQLIENLSAVDIPLSLLSQYMPIQYHKIRKKHLKNHPHDILLDAVIHVLDEYYYAVIPDTILSVKNN